VILGGVGFYVGELNTDRVLCETLLYVRVWARGGAVAKALVAAMEEEARLYNCTAILAGSSLHNHSHTTRIYEDAGFTTNLTFRKELTYV
jgi:L-amino acid N-acyltransferase YncA